MNTQEWFRNKLESFKEDFDFRLETLLLDLTETISKKMEKNNLNRTKLAELLGVSPSAVTKILNGNSNFTLKSLLSLADALELDLKIEFKEKGVIISPKIHIPIEFGSALWGDFISTSTTMVGRSTVSIVPNASTSGVAPSPTHETERRGLETVVNA